MDFSTTSRPDVASKWCCSSRVSSSFVSCSPTLDPKLCLARVLRVCERAWELLPEEIAVHVVAVQDREPLHGTHGDPP